MPRLASEVDVSVPFSPSEFLYRRAFPFELNSKGELVPTQLESFSFSKEVEGAPSFLRGEYAKPRDVIHQDCAGKTDVSSCSVLRMMVSELPGLLLAGDGKRYSFWPVHKPLPKCGAHCVIGSHLFGDLGRTYVKPSAAVVSQLRVEICRGLKPCDT